jgi:hypothetical protein
MNSKAERRKKRIVRSTLELGQHVVSVAVGFKDSFRGTVVSKPTALSYVVREDGTGKEWLRDLSELNREKSHA